MATFSGRENAAELALKLKEVYRNDKSRMREADLVYHTFYEGGTDMCRSQYYRHINRVLNEKA